MNRAKLCRVALVLAALLLPATTSWGAAGDLLWEKQFQIPLYSNITINAIAASQTSVIVCGSASGSTATPPGPFQVGFVRALDVATGDLKWEYQLSSGSQNNLNSITIDGSIALVLGAYSGWIQNPPSSVSKCYLRACNADTGQILWQTEKDMFQMIMAATLPAVPLMTTANNRTFLAVPVASTVPVTGFADACVVRAFQEKVVTTAPNSLLMD
jgi:hypothetical protein